VTFIEAINRAASQLAAAGVTTARLDAEVLLRYAITRDRAWLLAHMQEELADDHRDSFERAVARRVRREPLQYITGRQEFWGLEFMVTPDVLIPRPETELIIESAVRSVRDRNRPQRIIDLCTGSGCIAVCLAKELPQARILATDTSSQAISVARGNARQNGVADRIRFLEGDLFSPLEELDIHGQVDIIVSNPPYVPSGDFSALQPEVRDYEPKMALLAGPDGTQVQRRIINEASRFLMNHGLLIVEMGLGQADPLAQLIRQRKDYGSLEILKDLAGIDRVIVAKKTTKG
jgi:release factor glutamine methyltransferase